MVEFEGILMKLVSDPRYLSYCEFGETRPRHPEGKIKNHILQLETNLKKLESLITVDEHWVLMFLIHCHDICKMLADQEGLPSLHPRSHATLSKKFASEYTNREDVLNMIQYHDENFFLWEQFKHDGYCDAVQLNSLVNNIENWDIFLAFTIVDGYIPGKELGKIPWFINEVKPLVSTRVDTSWFHRLIAE